MSLFYCLFSIAAMGLQVSLCLSIFIALGSYLYFPNLFNNFLEQMKYNHYSQVNPYQSSKTCGFYLLDVSSVLLLGSGIFITIIVGRMVFEEVLRSYSRVIGRHYILKISLPGIISF